MVKIREIRRRKKMSVTELACAAGITRMSIYRYEQGVRTPTIDVAGRIANVLGVTIDELMRARDDYDEKQNSGLLEE